MLDGFSGAGGSGRGYQMAGCEIVGVDVIDQPHYPGRFIRADFLKLSVDFLREFDLIHCSPPCQRYTSLRHAPGRHRDADLIGPTRELLIASGVDYVIENVSRRPGSQPDLLCGSMFGLATPDGAELRRHRLVETSFSCSALACCHKPGAAVIGVYGGHARCRRRRPGRTINRCGLHRLRRALRDGRHVARHQRRALADGPACFFRIRRPAVACRTPTRFGTADPGDRGSRPRDRRARRGFQP